MSDEPIRLLVLEDGEIWIDLAEEMAEVRDGERPIVLAGDPCRTASEVILAIEETRPDVVLIDSFVPWSRGGREWPWGVRTVAEITRRYGREAPLRILWTTRPSELEKYAFRRFGGHNVANKGHALRRHTLEIVRQTVDGRCWEPPRPEPRSPEDDRVIRSRLDIVALLAAGKTDDEASQWLTKHGRRPLAPTTVGAYVQDLRRALDIPERAGRLRELIPEAAFDYGYRWIPIDYVRWDPNRPTSDDGPTDDMRPGN